MPSQSSTPIIHRDLTIDEILKGVGSPDSPHGPTTPRNSAQDFSEEASNVTGVYTSALLWLEPGPSRSQSLATKAAYALRKPQRYREEDTDSIRRDQVYQTVQRQLTAHIPEAGTSEHEKAVAYLREQPGAAREILKQVLGTIAEVEGHNAKTKLLTNISLLSSKDSSLINRLEITCSRLVGEEFAALHLTSLVIEHKERARDVTVPEDI